MPIRWRLTIFNALAIGTILVVLGLALVFFLERSLVSNLQEMVANRAYEAAEATREADEGELFAEDRADELTLDGVFIVVREDDGTVIGQTEDLTTNRPAADEIWRAAVEAGAPAAGTTDLSVEAPEYVYAVPVETEQGTRIVEAGATYGSVTDTLEAIRKTLAAGILIALIFSVVGAYLLARAALTPIESLARGMRGIEAENLSHRLPVENEQDEVGSLTLAVNALLSRMESAFEQREEALEEQRRFVADAGHELRTPLTSISGYARMLSRWGLEDRATAEESVSAIERESRRMSVLVDELLTLARGDENVDLDRERCDLALLAREATDDARAAAEGKLEVRYDGTGEVWACFDRAKVRQAVSVLLDNAVRYTPEGGSVEVRASSDGEVAQVEVRDTGVGIPGDHLGRVFERFHRVDRSRSGEGTGLGLAIARQISDAHGGGITVESRVGEGSRFTLSVPVRIS